MNPKNLPVVSATYGAPMGRRDTVADADIALRFHLYRMRMVDGCYDTGGAYWGCGSYATGYMYRAYVLPGEDNAYNECFVRARTRVEAKEKVRCMFPLARFYV